MENFVVTIARGFGSGGKKIGLELAEKMNIPCYESEILDMASDASGISRDLFFEKDEQLKKNRLFSIVRKTPREYTVSPQSKDFVSDDNLFCLQADIIKKLAETQSCVIIGKCADYVLEGYPNVFRIYIDAPRTACRKFLMDRTDVTAEEADKMISKTDRYRADYYKFYTKGREWTNPTNYDLFINSDRVGLEKCAELIEMYVNYSMQN